VCRCPPRRRPALRISLGQTSVYFLEVEKMGLIHREKWSRDSLSAYQFGSTDTATIFHLPFSRMQRTGNYSAPPHQPARFYNALKAMYEGYDGALGLSVPETGSPAAPGFTVIKSVATVGDLLTIVTHYMLKLRLRNRTILGRAFIENFPVAFFGQGKSSIYLCAKRNIQLPPTWPTDYLLRSPNFRGRQCCIHRSLQRRSRTT
jgi:hypothetical protein